MIQQKASKIKGKPPELQTQDELGNNKIIKTSKNYKCLGGHIQNNLQWQALLETGEDAVIPSLIQKLGMLKHLGKTIQKKMQIITGKWPNFR